MCLLYLLTSSISLTWSYNGSFKEGILLSNGSVIPKSLLNECKLENGSLINRNITTNQQLNCSNSSNIMLWYQDVPSVNFKLNENFKLSALTFHRTNAMSVDSMDEIYIYYDMGGSMYLSPNQHYSMMMNVEFTSFRYFIRILNQTITFDFPCIVTKVESIQTENVVEFKVDTKSDNFTSCTICIENICNQTTKKIAQLLVNKTGNTLVTTTFVLPQGNTEIYHFQYTVTEITHKIVYLPSKWLIPFTTVVVIIFLLLLLILVVYRKKNNKVLRIHIHRDDNFIPLMVTYAESPKLQTLNQLFANLDETGKLE